MRFISSSSASIFSSCRSFFDFGGSLPRSFSSAFSTESLGVPPMLDHPHNDRSSGWLAWRHLQAVSHWTSPFDKTIRMIEPPMAQLLI
jgi:hypothetical protein